MIKIIEKLRSKVREKIKERVEQMTEEILESYEKEFAIEMGKGKNNTKQKLKIVIEKLKEVIKKLRKLIIHLGKVNASKEAIEAIEKVIECFSKVIERLRLLYKTMNKGIFNIHEMLGRIKDTFKEFRREQRNKQRRSKHKDHSLPIESKEIECPTRIPTSGNITVTLVLKSNLNENTEVNVVVIDEEGNVLIDQSGVIMAYAEEELN